MYFTADQITRSIASLGAVHPFHGITFLTCKRAKLPVGRQVSFSLDSETDAFLKQYHRIDPSSEWFFQPFKSIKKWVRPDYAPKGLQSINTQTFGQAFIHPPARPLWGWSSNYINVLKSRLPGGRKIPAFHLSVWLYRSKDWPDGTTRADVARHLLSEFNINSKERIELFDTRTPGSLLVDEPFQPTAAKWSDLKQHIPAAPDAKPEQGGTLAYLETNWIGPCKHLVFEPGRRLSLLTGDNGLGKTFVLECAWWALTGSWAGRPAYPTARASGVRPTIAFAIEGESKAQRRTIFYDWKAQAWPPTKGRPTIPGLVAYARVDGSFAVWDPARQPSEVVSHGGPLILGSENVWNGLSGRIEGLIRDWVLWQSSPTKYPFDTFVRVLAKLSPPDLGKLTPGEPVRIPDDPRPIPTIHHPYGDTPVVYASAGVRRVLTLAYLIVWAWNEHKIASDHARIKPQRRMVVLVDELEAHLHPLWQRVVLPAMVEVSELLGEEIVGQYIVATHSPLVMASAESLFSDETDKLYHLELSDGNVSFDQLDFVRFGEINAWLTSPVFDLRHARSTEAEAAIEAAKEVQSQDTVTKQQVREVTAKLVRYLASDDRFWPRWVYFAEQHGVKL